MSNHVDRIVPLPYLRHEEVPQLQRILKLAANPNILSFGVGLPDPLLFPVQAVKKSMLDAMDDRNSLQYSSPSQTLKKMIVELMKLRGVQCNERRIVLTSGSQQGLDLLCKLLLPRGGTLGVEETTYSGIFNAALSHSPAIMTVKTSMDKGIDIDDLESRIIQGQRPALLYCIPDGHNPMGVSIPVENRRKLAALARRYKFPIIEDDPYGFISYEQNFKPLFSYEDQWVIYTGTFSKIIAPSLRVGWLIVPEHLVEKLEVLKEGTDLNTSTFSQHVASNFLENTNMDHMLSDMIEHYRMKRDVLVDALQDCFPSGTSFRIPNSGFFIWAELPSHYNSETLLELAINRYQTAYVPGSAFQAPGAPLLKNAIRLSFSTMDENQIREGIRRIGQLFQ